jgi:excisionase family DNA binding protein
VSEETLLLTVPDVMARMQIGRHKVYELINTRRLASVRIGRCRRIPAAAVTNLVNGLMDGSGV